MNAELSWTGPDIHGQTNPTPHHFAHIAAWEEQARINRIFRTNARAFERHAGGMW